MWCLPAEGPNAGKEGGGWGDWAGQKIEIYYCCKTTLYDILDTLIHEVVELATLAANCNWYNSAGDAETKRLIVLNHDEFTRIVNEVTGLVFRVLAANGKAVDQTTPFEQPKQNKEQYKWTL